MGWFPEQGLWCRAQVTKRCVRNSGEYLSIENVVKGSFKSVPSMLLYFNVGSSHLSLKGVRNLEVKVRRIDYGDSACLFLSNLKELPREVAQVPVQALKVSLANVRMIKVH